MTVLELRQYTMVPGRREEFVELFDREFVETQEALGMEVVGQFVDLDRPDRYVWIRRFPDMEARKAALEAFYSGPVWAEHSGAANAMMTEWHDVLLLKPAEKGRDVAVNAEARPPAGQRNIAARSLAILVWDVAPHSRVRFAEAVARAFSGAPAIYVSEPSPNTFPRLPVRENASVVVAVVDRAPPGGEATIEGIRASQVLRLAPTPRSALSGT